MAVGASSSRFRAGTFQGLFQGKKGGGGDEKLLTFSTSLVTKWAGSISPPYPGLVWRERKDGQLSLLKGPSECTEIVKGWTRTDTR